MWKNILCLLIIVLSAGCSAPSTINPVHTSIPQETSQRTLPTNPGPTATPTSTNSSFTEINLAHQNKQSFSDYSDFHLLVKTSDSNLGVLNLSNMEIQNKALLSDSTVNYPRISSNGVWVAQLNYQDDSKLLQIKNFLTGKEISATLPQEAVLLQWVDDQKVSVWGSSSHLECLDLLLVYDIPIGEIHYPASPMPDLQTAECIQLPLLTSDGMKMIYPWQIYDFEAGTSLDAFPFMRNLTKESPAYLLKEIGGNISVVYAEEDTLYYRLNTALDEIGNPNLFPETTQLPGFGTKDYWWQPFTWITNQMQVGIDLVDQNTDIRELTIQNQPVPTNFFLVDLAEYKIYDYDLDRAVFEDGSLRQTVRTGFSSPDGEYFAWTVYESGTGHPMGSKVLQLSSGFIVSIPNVEILGWVVPSKN